VGSDAGSRRLARRRSSSVDPAGGPDVVRESAPTSVSVSHKLLTRRKPSAIHSAMVPRKGVNVSGLPLGVRHRHTYPSIVGSFFENRRVGTIPGHGIKDMPSGPTVRSRAVVCRPRPARCAAHVDHDSFRRSVRPCTWFGMEWVCTSNRVQPGRRCIQQFGCAYRARCSIAPVSCSAFRDAFYQNGQRRRCVFFWDFGRIAAPQCPPGVATPPEGSPEW